MRRTAVRRATGAKRLPNRFQQTVIVTEDDITKSNKLISKESKNNENNGVHSIKILV